MTEKKNEFSQKIYILGLFFREFNIYLLLLVLSIEFFVDVHLHPHSCSSSSHGGCRCLATADTLNTVSSGKGACT